MVDNKNMLLLVYLKRKISAHVFEEESESSTYFEGEGGEMDSNN